MGRGPAPVPNEGRRGRDTALHHPFRPCRSAGAQAPRSLADTGCPSSVSGLLEPNFCHFITQTEYSLKKGIHRSGWINLKLSVTLAIPTRDTSTTLQYSPGPGRAGVDHRHQGFRSGRYTSLLARSRPPMSVSGACLSKCDVMGWIPDL